MNTDDSGFSWIEAEKDLMEGIDTTVAHVARVRSYWLGGKDNYRIDREAGDQIPGILPLRRAQLPRLAVKLGLVEVEVEVEVANRA